MIKQIIAISGKQFSGKDAATEILLKLLPNFKRVAIGDAIKMEYSKRTGLSIEEIEKNKPVYRPDLIALGDEGRAISPDFWLKKLIELDYDIIIPDMRLKKELKLFRENNAVTIRVEASREARALRGNIVKEDDLTETDLDDVKDWDFVIENSSTYENLVEKATKLAEELKNFKK